MTPNDHYFSANPKSRYDSKLIRTIACNHMFEFFTAQGVFSANKVDTGTSVLLKKLEIPDHGKVLDLGCGIGVVGIVVAILQPSLKVHFVDINSRATELTKKNAEKYELTAFSIFTGDYIKILQENSILYNAIYFNPPIRLGKKIYFQHILHALNYLETNGYIHIVIKKKLGAESAYNYFKANLEETSFSMKILGKNSGYWVFEIRKINLM